MIYSESQLTQATVQLRTHINDLQYLRERYYNDPSGEKFIRVPFSWITAKYNDAILIGDTTGSEDMVSNKWVLATKGTARVLGILFEEMSDYTFDILEVDVVLSTLVEDEYI